MDALRVENVCHWFGLKKVLNNVNLRVGAGQIVAVVGPSGCGKSTLLRGILGTHPPRRGHVYAGKHEIKSPTRDIGIVYQHYSLYDFLTARDNVAFGLKLDQTSLWERVFGYFRWRQMRKDHREKAVAMLQKVQLEHAIHQYPSQLSGGMRQRVAIAQALVMEPRDIVAGRTVRSTR